MKERTKRRAEERQRLKEQRGRGIPARLLKRATRTKSNMAKNVLGIVALGLGMSVLGQNCFNKWQHEQQTSALNQRLAGLNRAFADQPEKFDDLALEVSKIAGDLYCQEYECDPKTLGTNFQYGSGEEYLKTINDYVSCENVHPTSDVTIFIPDLFQTAIIKREAVRDTSANNAEAKMMTANNLLTFLVYLDNQLAPPLRTVSTPDNIDNPLTNEQMPVVFYRGTTSFSPNPNDSKLGRLCLTKLRLPLARALSTMAANKILNQHKIERQLPLDDVLAKTFQTRVLDKYFSKTPDAQ